MLFDLLGSLRSYDGCCNENDTSKYNFALGYVCSDFSMLVMSYKISEVYFRLLGTKGFHVMAENERLTAVGRRRIPRRYLADYVKKMHQRACRTCTAITLPH